MAPTELAQTEINELAQTEINELMYPDAWRVANLPEQSLGAFGLLIFLFSLIVQETVLFLDIQKLKLGIKENMNEQHE